MRSMLRAWAAAALALATVAGHAHAQTESPAPTAVPVPAPAPFGYDVFTGGAGQVAEGPVDEGYLLGPGDEIVVSLWGELNETFNMVVLPEGFVELPDNGGRIQTNGVTLRELRPIVIQALSRIRAGFIDPKDPAKSTAVVDVRLGRIRPLMAGGLREEAFPAAAVLRRSLGAAGGSELATRATTDVTIDLPAALADPGGKSDVVLKDGDLLFVPTSSGAVEVRGAVVVVTARPAAVSR